MTWPGAFALGPPPRYDAPPRGRLSMREQQYGKYLLLDRIAVGGMAEICKPSPFKADVPEQLLMRALEKDPDQRHRTAWEMQSDLDRFLVGNEFAHSNRHLATFMRQLFADEMDAERARLSGSEGQRLAKLAVDKLTAEEDPSGPRYLGIPTPREATLPGRGQAPKLPDATGDTLIEVPLQSEELEQLAGIASRNAISVQALVHELVQSFLRFR